MTDWICSQCGEWHSDHQSQTFDIRTATIAELTTRAEYLENFPAHGRYRLDLHAEAAALRALAAQS